MHKKQPIRKIHAQTLSKINNVIGSNMVKTLQPKKKYEKKDKNKTLLTSNKKQYGTSKLEQYFAHEFLDKLGLKYIYEYEAKDIGRFYDFAVTAYDDVEFLTETKHGIECIKQEGQKIPISFMIELDGSYWHSDPRIVKDKKLTYTQKHNQFVDFLKDKWCEKKCIPLVRIWEFDVKNNPQEVFNQLSPYITEANRKKLIADRKKSPH